MQTRKRQLSDGAEYTDSVTFTVEDANLKSVTVNGEALTAEDGKYTLTVSDGQQVVVAEDEAGNKTVVKVMVKASANNSTDDTTKATDASENTNTNSDSNSNSRVIIGQRISYICSRKEAQSLV